MDSVYTARKKQTGWFQLAIVVALTFVSFYYIKNAFDRPYAELQLYNEVRITEIYGTEEIE